ncbi:MAG: hypothetical protein IT330_11405 [Anaerolineae bacterium]|nr:hypothetical protein [Anaerolineae bacterium]
MTYPPALPGSEMSAVEATYTAALARYGPEIAEMGRRLWQRIASPHWALEWALPRWLGDAFGLPLDTSHALVVGNVLGLAYVRLQDDLADGESNPASRPAAISLGTALYHQTIRHYMGLFDPASPFWNYLDTWMGQWLRATIQSNKPSITDFRAHQEDHFLRLAGRGAPLKICAAAAGLLAARAETIPPLAAALDHLLVSAVLLDHAHDWEQDLASGRYNAFIAYTSPLPQETEQREANRRHVLAELMLGGGGRAYFGIINDHLRLAGQIVQPLKITGLDAYLLWLEAHARDYGEELAARARARLREVTNLIFAPGEG